MSGTVLVIGASGKTGRELVRLLAGSGVRVRAATRNPQKYPRESSSVEPFGFDFERPESFAPALSGAERVFLMARPGDNRSDQAAAPFIEEARKTVRLIVNLTAMGVETDEDFMLRKLEKHIEASGVPWVHLRPNWFMQNFSSGPMYADIRMTGALHLPAADAKLSFIDVRDVASVGFAALTEGRHAGRAYTLTGGEALDHFEVTEKLSRAAGKKISYVPITDEMARGGLKRSGVAEDQIERWSEFFRKVRQGLCAPVSPDTESVLGRPPVLFDTYARDHAASWK